ncbi:metal/formaldehyde-sensitive transcriptional repressor [Rhizobium sp. SG570]|uniref:metal/formaldehyde-sensitive transcriptional repressor n=1 Tax=Rhizobium sp. SG570 TaxID=2587113 RepID=UPI001446A803|nr:metal/formaldehyde-sensitive transcriptional repressor [Rhizobium sp. SG570]NKJ40284.1 DNA-binding FrmR family transcriptional regulator [Rhizobium sp. SG570]
MTHTVREKAKLINRVRRLRGQVEGLERMLEDEKSHTDVMQLIAGIRGAMNGLMNEVIEDHIRFHLQAADLPQSERDEGAAELIDIVRAYLK